MVGRTRTGVVRQADATDEEVHILCHHLERPSWDSFFFPAPLVVVLPVPKAFGTQAGIIVV